MSMYRHSETKKGPGRGRRPNAVSVRAETDPTYGNKLANKAARSCVTVKNRGFIYNCAFGWGCAK